MTDRSDGGTTRRAFLEATGGVAAASLAGGVGATSTSEPAVTGDSVPDTESVDGTGDPQRSGTLTMVATEATSFDPVRAGAGDEMTRQLFDGLVHMPAGEARVVGRLATGFGFRSAGDELRFALDADATFHDGRSVTAADVRYSLERLAASPNSQHGYRLLSDLDVDHRVDADGDYVPGSLGVRTPDAHTVVLELDGPVHEALGVLATLPFAVVPEGAVDDVPGYSGGTSQAAFGADPVGAGPYELTDYTPGQRVELMATGDYHGPPPRFQHLEWRLLGNATAQWHYSVIDENADEAVVPAGRYDPAKVSVDSVDARGRLVGTYGPLANGETVDYVRRIEPETFYVGFNHDRVPKPVRVAFALVTNAEAMVDRVTDRPYRPATHVTPPNLFPGGYGGYQSHASGYPYGANRTRTTRARQVMQGAGYDASTPFELTLTAYPSSIWRASESYLDTRLSAAHIDLTFEEESFADLLSRGRAGDLSAYTLGIPCAYPHPDRALWPLYPPNTDTSGSPRSYTNWGGTPAARDATDAWERAQSSAPGERSVRHAAYLTMEEANWTDLALLPLFHTTEERFWYGDADVRPAGAMGSEHRQFVDPTAATDDLSNLDTDGDDTMEFGEVLDAIRAFNDGDRVGGEDVGFREVLDAIRAFNTGADV